jgi:dipeptidase E
MKLLLTSAGIFNKSISDALLELTERPFTELNLAFIPTAANVAIGDKSWMIDDLVNCKKLGFKVIDIVDISAIPKELWLPRLQAADVLLVEGGDASYLMYWFEKSGLKELLPKMLETKVYVGISAGSMIMGSGLDSSMVEELYLEAVMHSEEDDGMGIIDALIRPHLNSLDYPKMNLDYMEKMSKEFPDTFYAIDDNTAIKVVDGKMEVVSEGVWKKFN